MCGATVNHRTKGYMLSAECCPTKRVLLARRVLRRAAHLGYSPISAEEIKYAGKTDHVKTVGDADHGITTILPGHGLTPPYYRMHFRSKRGSSPSDPDALSVLTADGAMWARETSFRYRRTEEVGRFVRRRFVVSCP